jgi:hypothetical protein
MAKKRELVWIETPVFKGWGCNLCSWKYQIPKTAATSKSPSLETRSAFLHHRCATTFKHKRNIHEGTESSPTKKDQLEDASLFVYGRLPSWYNSYDSLTPSIESS